MQWHLDGWTLERYLALSWSARWDLHAALSEMIRRTAVEVPTRPKQWRR